MKREELRYILRREFSADTDKFQIIKEVAILIATETNLVGLGICSAIISKN